MSINPYWGFSGHMTLMYLFLKRRMMEILLHVIKSDDLVNIEEALKTFHMVMFWKGRPPPPARFGMSGSSSRLL